MSVWLYALAIDEVRDIFGAPDDVASALRAIAADRFAPKTRTAPGLLGKLGPMFARPVEGPVTQPGTPNRDDMETLLSGRYVRPDRLAPSWLLVEAWLEAMAWDSHRDDLAEADLDAFDFDLAKAGVPTSLGLRALVSRRWDVPLGMAPGLLAGFVPGEQVRAMSQAWTQAVDDLDDRHRERAGAYASWLGRYPSWDDAARAGHRPAPDLVTIMRA